MMLDACRRKVAALPADVASRITLVEGNMTGFDLGRRFALITIPFRAFSHLIAIEDQLACLACVRRHLADGGELVFDVFQPRMDRVLDPAGAIEAEDLPWSPLPDGRRVRRTARRAEVRQSEQTMQIEFNCYIKDESGTVERLQESFPFRYYFRDELEALLARAGFKVAALYGWFDQSPMLDTPREMIFVARAT